MKLQCSGCVGRSYLMPGEIGPYSPGDAKAATVWVQSRISSHTPETMHRAYVRVLLPLVVRSLGVETVPAKQFRSSSNFSFSVGMLVKLDDLTKYSGDSRLRCKCRRHTLGFVYLSCKTQVDLCWLDVDTHYSVADAPFVISCSSHKMGQELQHFMSATMVMIL